MNVTKAQSVNLKSDDISSKTSSKKESDVKFSDELKNLKSTEKQEKKTKNDDEKTQEKSAVKKNQEGNSVKNAKEDNPDSAINGLNDTIDEINKLNQKDENLRENIKNAKYNDDKQNKYEVFGLIDNNMNLQEQLDKFNVQTGANMNFNSDGQPFSAFVEQDNTKKLSSSAKDLAEEKSILSTMEENIAIANKNMAMSKNKTVENEHGVHKVDKKTNLVVDTVVSYDHVVMNKEDVEFFANLVENGITDMNEIKNPQRAARVSKTLADLLAKAMNDNKPVRIDFDNNISVIIKIDRAGKISADFLPSSQVAEAYLKENLPLLKQRFDDNNIDYNELSQRQRKQDTQQDNRKKDKKDE